MNYVKLSESILLLVKLLKSSFGGKKIKKYNVLLF